jgi:hypothetical protein
VWLDAGLLGAALALIVFTFLPQGTRRGAVGGPAAAS